MEKIEITFLHANAETQTAQFKMDLQRQGIDGLTDVEILRIENKSGEMGTGRFTNSLNAFVNSVSESLDEILKSSFRFSLKFRVDIEFQ